MTFDQIIQLFDSYSDDEAEAALAQVDQARACATGPELAHAIRNSFKPGSEQGNGRRLEALVKLEGAGCLDVIRDVLEAPDDVGGIYSNLRNGALELIRDHFLGDPALEAPLWRAVEIDEYLNIDALYPVAKAYDPARALALLVPNAELGTPAAVAALAREPTARPVLRELLENVLAGDRVDRADRFLEGLGDAAAAPDLAAVIAPYAATQPAAAELAILLGDVAGIRTLAERLTSTDVRWRAAAVKAVAALSPDDAFERVSPLFSRAERTTPAGRGGLADVTYAFPDFTKPLDPRWLAFLTARLDDETDRSVRGCVVEALGALGPDAALAIVLAPRDDKDHAVLEAMPLALELIGPGDGVLALVRDAVRGAKSKRKKALAAALEALEELA